MRITFAAGTVTNFGTIVGTGFSSVGVDLDGGGRVTNGASGATAALISGRTFGVRMIAGSKGTITTEPAARGQR